MTVVRGFIITVASGVAFAVLGGLFGYAMGIFVPDYYRLVFRSHPGVQFDPAQVGLGLGLTQGLAVGLFIGLVTVVAVVWFRSRLTNRSS